MVEDAKMDLTIGDLIKSIRIQKGFTQKQLAEKMNISQQTVAQYEKAKKVPKLETIKKISAALDVPYSDLLNIGHYHSNGWIPVSNRFPEEDGRYLVSGVWLSGKKAVGECDFSVSDGYFDACWNFNVLAWMPLPKPYVLPKPKKEKYIVETIQVSGQLQMFKWSDNTIDFHRIEGADESR